MVTDMTQGDFTTHSTKTQISDHTVSRNCEKNQCNYSEKNEFSYKCRSSGVLWLNCLHYIHYHNVSKQLQRRVKPYVSVSSLTSHCELAVQLRVHLFVPLVASHFIHSFPHHCNSQHKTLRDKRIVEKLIYHIMVTETYNI